MCPTQMIGLALASGELVEMVPGAHIDVDLYWQSWRLSIGWLHDFRGMFQRRANTILDLRKQKTNAKARCGRAIYHVSHNRAGLVLEIRRLPRRMADMKKLIN